MQNLNRREETKDHQNNCHEDEAESEEISVGASNSGTFEVHKYDLAWLKSGLMLLWSVTSEKFKNCIINSNISENFKTFENQICKMS